MNDLTWQKELENKYIHLFMTDECGSVIRGIETGEGWKLHIEQFLEHISHINSKKIKIFQIKEKFGQIRVYVDCPDRCSYVVGMCVGRLEALCHITCEKCGIVQMDIERKIDGWMMNLCDKCYNERISSE